MIRIRIINPGSPELQIDMKGDTDTWKQTRDVIAGAIEKYIHYRLEAQNGLLVHIPKEILQSHVVIVEEI